MPDQYQKYIDWEQTRTARNLAGQNYCQYVVQGTPYDTWAGDLLQIGNEPEKETLGKGPCFVVQRPQRGRRR